MIDDCDITGNANPGVAIATGADPTVRGCRIRDNKSDGIYVFENGPGDDRGR